MSASALRSPQSPSAAEPPDQDVAAATGSYLAALLPPGARVLQLPQLHSAALFIPARIGPVRRWRATAMYPGNRPAARALRGIARCAGALRLGRTRRTQTDGAWALGEFLHDALPDAAEVSVLLKLADSAPRATIEVRSASGRVLGYAKYAVQRNAIARLERECAVLARGHPARAPRVLKYGAVGRGQGLLLSPLPGRRFWSVLPPPPGLVEFVGRQTRLPPVPLSQHPWVGYMREKTGGDSDALFAGLDAARWPVVVHHGDLLPSNLRVGPDGAFAAVDWEYGTCAGFPHLDLLQYVLLILVVLRRQPAAGAARNAAAWLAAQTDFGMAGGPAVALTRLAALDLWVNARDDGEAADAPGQRLWRAIAFEPW